MGILTRLERYAAANKTGFMTTLKTACVATIYTCPVAAGLPVMVSKVRAVAGAGLVGDRYYEGQGTWSHWPGGGRQVTLIEEEVIASLEHVLATVVTGAQTRRNIVTRNVRLNDWVGFDFAIGEVVMRGVRLCEPCAHLEQHSHRGIAAALQRRGGLRADILRGGVIHQGDRLRLVGHLVGH